MNTLSDWLVTELDVRGWSQRELSRRSGVSPTQISDIISGKANPGADSSIAIARALSKPPEDILRLAGILPPLPPPVENDQEAITLFRQLDQGTRHVILATMRNLLGIRSAVINEQRAGYTASGGSSRLAQDITSQLQQMTPGDQRRILDLIHRLTRGETE